MLLIAAAMEEELRVAISLCKNRKRIPARGVRIRQGIKNNRTISFLKTGVGPGKAAASLEQALNKIQFSRVLVIGYCGALDPGLTLGKLVVVENALSCSLDEEGAPLDHMRIDNTFRLANCEDLLRAAKSAGLDACLGDTLTSAHIIGDPEHKRRLFERFHAAVVDMETAELARVAAIKAVPLGCIRAISDRAHDTFLTPFSYDPSVGLANRALRIMRERNPLKTYREWREQSSEARAILRRFLSHYL